MDGLAETASGRTRLKTLSWLMAATSLGSLGLVAGFTIANVAAAEIRQRNDWTSGLAGMMVLLGSAVASVPISNYMARHGRRPGLMIGYGAATIGAALAVIAEVNSNFLLLLTAMLLFGMGFTSTALARYAASDIAFAENRARYISFVTWCSVVGGVAAPNLVGLLGTIANRAGFPDLTGSFGISFVTCALALVVLHLGLRPDPLELSGSLMTEGDRHEQPQMRSRREILGIPAVQVAVATLIVGQLVMVMVMSMTALHMRSLDHGWNIVGLVISGHVAGMFALSPLTGWASDRFGRTRLIVGGGVIILIATLLAASRPTDHAMLGIALFLLGLGWNCGYVASSALLTDAVEVLERPATQGFADFMTGLVSAGASFAAELVYSGLGYASLSVLGAGLILIPMTMVVLRRSALRPVPQAT